MQHRYPSAATWGPRFKRAAAPPPAAPTMPPLMGPPKPPEPPPLMGPPAPAGPVLAPSAAKPKFDPMSPDAMPKAPYPNAVGPEAYGGAPAAPPAKNPGGNVVAPTGYDAAATQSQENIGSMPGSKERDALLGGDASQMTEPGLSTLEPMLKNKLVTDPKLIRQQITGAAPKDRGALGQDSDAGAGDTTAPPPDINDVKRPPEPGADEGAGKAPQSPENLLAIGKSGLMKQFAGDPTAVMTAAQEQLHKQVPPDVAAKGPQGITEWISHIWKALGEFGPKIGGVSLGHILVGMGLGLGAIGLMKTMGGEGGMAGPLMGIGGLAGAGALAYHAMGQNTADSSGGLDRRVQNWANSPAGLQRPQGPQAASGPPGPSGSAGGPAGALPGAAGTTGAAGGMDSLTMQDPAIQAEIKTLTQNPATRSFFDASGAPNGQAIVDAYSKDPTSLTSLAGTLSPGLRHVMAKEVGSSKKLQMAEASGFVRRGTRAGLMKILMS